MIGNDGVTTHARNGGSDLSDGEVVRWVAGVFGALTFPRPEGGIVTVVSPMVLERR